MQGKLNVNRASEGKHPRTEMQDSISRTWVNSEYVYLFKPEEYELDTVSGVSPALAK